MSNDHSEQGHLGELVHHPDSGDPEIVRELNLATHFSGDLVAGNFKPDPIASDVLDIAADRLLADAKGEKGLNAVDRGYNCAMNGIADWAESAALVWAGTNSGANNEKAAAYRDCARFARSMMVKP